MNKLHFFQMSNIQILLGFYLFSILLTKKLKSSSEILSLKTTRTRSIKIFYYFEDDFVIIIDKAVFPRYIICF